MRRHDYFEIPIYEVIAETDSAVSLVLDVPKYLDDVFRYRPGQFVTVRVLVGGKHRHRCYSLASAPDIDARPKITIKRVAEGLVSNEICSNVRGGQTLLVQPPAGMFVPSSLDDDLLLFAGGSGITPVLSILKSVLLNGKGNVALIYANRNEASVIFRDELLALSAAHPDRFTLIHWLESVQGLPTAKRIAELVRPFATRESFICGPEAFMACVMQVLRSLSVPDEKAHLERFISLPDEQPEKAVNADPQQPATKLTITLDGTEHELSWAPDQTMLDSMLAAGLNAPSSCRVGGCGACMCRVRTGEVRMTNNLVLDERDIKEGWVLACQAHPLSSEVRCEIG